MDRQLCGSGEWESGANAQPPTRTIAPSHLHNTVSSPDLPPHSIPFPTHIMSSTTTTTSLSTVGIPSSATGSIRLRGEGHQPVVDPIAIHSAQQQPPAPANDGRRTDREYPPMPEGEQPSKLWNV